MFRGKASILAVLIALVAFAAPAALARDGIPLPKPRPAEAPSSEAARAADKPDADAPQTEAAKPESTPEAPPQPPPPTACRLALTPAIAIAPSLPDITGPGSCGGTDLVRLEAVVLPDGSRVPLTPAATLRCPMASALAAWVRADLAPLAASLATRLVALDNYDSYDCRGRNRVRGAKLSEHGRANAIDLRGFKLADGRMLSLTDRAAPLAVRERVRQSVCERFATVLGPASDGYHEEHIHLDLAERRGGYKMCQWAVWEALPAIAPLLPAERPAEAPPRQVAAGEDGAPGAAPAPPQPEAAGPDQAEDAARQQAEPPPPPAKGQKARSAKSKPADNKPAKPAPAIAPTPKRHDDRRP
ncbi:extensin family protein [Rhodopseudomonas palustris]|uniref:extensin family protein n=1 Tax=Rhodopseudomonas palustris TaxID=1076 RepID=UPI002ACDB9D7|nr:extensin family protein [Rhodopseudomonas palustris]WQG99439.1 extensin family protein [Rhodopseudomonas palustris]